MSVRPGNRCLHLDVQKKLINVLSEMQFLPLIGAYTNMFAELSGEIGEGIKATQYSGLVH